MNIELLESFGQNFPQDFDGSLDSVSSAAVAAFNRLGSMLAVGCNDGRVVIWDFMTKGIAKVIQPHTHTICSLCWSRNGRKVITAAIDSNVCISDVLTGDIDRRLKFPSPVLKVQYNPRNSKMILITPMQHAAVVMDLDDNGGHVHRIIPADDDDLNICANFDRRGEHIFTGNSRSKISIFRCSDLVKAASFRISKEGGNVIAVKSIEFSRRGDWFLVNSGDRIIRVYNQKDVLQCNEESDNCDPEPVQKLQDLVNKTMWKKCAFSGDGEYICAGSARQHAIYIWERCVGNLVKILNGAKGEMLLDVVWHPIRPIVASVSSGVVSVWAQNQVENWSAFAPDFKELDENVEYEERESEFDLEDEDKIPETLMENGEDEIEVDVSTSRPVGVLLSSDEEDDAELQDNLDFLPIAPEVEEQDENWCLDQKYEDRMKSSYEKENTSSPKRKKPKIVKEVLLPDAPKDLEHPMLTKSGKDKGMGNRKGGTYRVKNDKRHHKERMK